MFAGEMRMKISATSQIYRSVVEGREGDPGSGEKGENSLTFPKYSKNHFQVFKIHLCMFFVSKKNEDKHVCT